jgi:nitrogen PTS system EIIA component
MEPSANSFRKVHHVIVSLLDFFEEELFIPELKARTKDAALQEMVKRLTSTGRIKDDGILLEMLHQRESLGSTGIGRGVAVPHGRSLAIGRLTIILGRSAEGIDFEAMDGKPVHLVFLTVAPPQERSNLYLPVLGKIVEVVKSARIRKLLLNAEDFKQVAGIISEVDEDA